MGKKLANGWRWVKTHHLLLLVVCALTLAGFSATRSFAEPNQSNYHSASMPSWIPPEPKPEAELPEPPSPEALPVAGEAGAAGIPGRQGVQGLPGIQGQSSGSCYSQAADLSSMQRPLNQNPYPVPYSKLVVSRGMKLQSSGLLADDECSGFYIIKISLQLTNISQSPAHGYVWLQIADKAVAGQSVRLQLQAGERLSAHPIFLVKLSAGQKLQVLISYSHQVSLGAAEQAHKGRPAVSAADLTAVRISN